MSKTSTVLLIFYGLYFDAFFNLLSIAAIIQPVTKPTKWAVLAIAMKGCAYPNTIHANIKPTIGLDTDIPLSGANHPINQEYPSNAYTTPDKPPKFAPSIQYCPKPENNAENKNS